MTWNPDQYLKFAAPRFRPALDLLGRINLADPKTVYDLGCGTGNVTRVLMERWPQAQVAGVDDSAEMLAQAAQQLPPVANKVRWISESLATWTPEQPADVIYSNAALQWLPDHDRLFPRLVDCVAAGGVLAVQMPRNFNAPSHTLITETLLSPRWKAKFSQFTLRQPVADPPFYYRLLAPLARSLDIWETEYTQVLEGRDPVKEWTKGTWLKQFLEVLPEADRAAFEEDYAARVRVAYPQGTDGKTLFPFKRLFIVLNKD